MSLKDQKHCILSWLVGEELASDIVRGNDILTIEVIPSDKNFPEVLSDNVNISLIKKTIVRKRPTIKSCNIWKQNMKSKYLKYGYCNKRLSKRTNGNNKVTCKMCLKWHHFQCIERKQNPSDLWFCRKCKINVNNSKSTYCY